MSFFDDMSKNELIKAIKEDFLRLYERMYIEKVYAGCLVTDDDASGMFLVFNTLEYLNKKDALLFGEDPFKEFREMLSPEEFHKSFGEYEGTAMSTKWIPDEWGYGNNSLEDSFLNKYNAVLWNVRYSLRTEFEVSKFKDEMRKVMIDSLSLLKKYIEEKLNNEILLFVSITDSEQSKLVENESAKKINSANSYNEFLKRAR